jgi:hypothetical protein
MWRRDTSSVTAVYGDVFIRRPSGDGHSGSADCAAIAVAERVL